VTKRKEKQRKKRQRQARRTAEAQQRVAVDPRRTVVVDVPLPDAGPLVIVEPIRLESGDDLYFHSPFVVTFYLLRAKALRDAAEPKRKVAITQTIRESDGTLSPRSPKPALDALEHLALAVILAAAAIEAHANDMISRLPNDAMIEIPERLGGRTVAVMRDKAAMDRLPISDKLARVVPILHGRPSIKGTAPWQKYKRLFRLRNALVHPRREVLNDPLKPGVFGRLLLGEGSSAPEDAASVIEAIEPGWIRAPARGELGLEP
jgi:hypothetical protein